jgi:hypothetical protein
MHAGSVCAARDKRIGAIVSLDGSFRYSPATAAHNIAKRKLAFIFPNCLLVPQGCHRIDAERASGWYQRSQNRNYSE